MLFIWLLLVHNCIANVMILGQIRFKWLRVYLVRVWVKSAYWLINGLLLWVNRDTRAAGTRLLGRFTYFFFEDFNVEKPHLINIHVNLFFNPESNMQVDRRYVPSKYKIIYTGIPYKSDKRNPIQYQLLKLTGFISVISVLTYIIKISRKTR